MGDIFEGIGSIFQGIPIVGDLLGSDTTAKRAQDASDKAAAEAQQREESRMAQFTSQQAGVKAQADAQAKAENEKMMADLKAAQETAKKQAAALAVTGGNLAPAGAVSAGLPGFDQLKKRAQGNVAPLTQSNLITAAPTLGQAAGINPAAGGRRYI
jgi:membrane protein involved in colicin uptake